ncbi:MAG: hypothetical protein RQ752_10605 [Thermohalobaculum sp.]|nr:hypothetical protein [Thermohalobaculum sp.]
MILAFVAIALMGAGLVHLTRQKPQPRAIPVRVRSATRPLPPRR